MITIEYARYHTDRDPEVIIHEMPVAVTLPSAMNIADKLARKYAHRVEHGTVISWIAGDVEVAVDGEVVHRATPDLRDMVEIKVPT